MGLKIFVYYADGYFENGDVGFESFSSSEAAEAFISERMSKDPKRTLDMYTVIEGTERKLETIKVVTKVQLV